tara:strand:+ start:24 stop:734 length:711 start_codon:yes stop_codon:yes gene_type:complete
MANKKKIIAIIQARVNSSRLPNKMFLNLHGYPICEWVYRRVVMSKKIDQIVFALPDTEENNTLAWYLQSIGADVFRGSESDVVQRFYQAANYTSASKIVRICADNPLICSSEIDRLIEFYQKNNCDYAYNHIPKNNKYPNGLGAEICSMSILKFINQNARKNNHREHLFNYIWSNTSEFSIKTFDPLEELAYPHLKLDIDTMSDYQFLLENEFRIQMSAHEVIKIANKISNSVEFK